jgi:amidase
MDIGHLLLNGSARAIGDAIAAGHLTSLEATKWYLHRIDQFNGKDAINAVRSVSPAALAQAEAADREIAAGRRRGPLHGVPYLAKDNIFTADGSTAAAGARALAGFMPPYQATIIDRLSRAGAVLLGKTNLPEFADFVSDVMPCEFSGAGGVVRNPLGIRYERGQGSSVGSAAAVSARFCAFAIGTETQNSIQTPCVFSSIVGFKPTVGRVSRHGIVPLVPSQDSPGPLTICVDDAALVFDAIQGGDVRDTSTLAFLAEPVGELADGSLAGVRIGVPRRFVADAVMNDDRAPAFDRVLGALSRAGATVVDPCDLPSAEQLSEIRSSVFRTEFKASLNELLGTLRPCGIDSLQALIEWNAKNPDAIPYGQSLLEAANATDGILAAQYVIDRRRDIALSVAGGIAGALACGAVDVLLSPMTAAAKCTGKAGAPVVALPAGSDRTGQPFGVSVYGIPGGDRQLLRIAAAMERITCERLLPHGQLSHPSS